MDNADFFMGLAQQALWITALASAPILIPTLVAGLLLGMIQAATSINEQTLTFDSTSQLLDERKKSVFLTVLSGTYDKTRDYWLTARDATTKIEALRVPLRVDLAFMNDF